MHSVRCTRSDLERQPRDGRRGSDDGRPERENMTVLEIRYQNAVEKIGGAAGLLNLPEQVKNVLKNTTDLKVKVKILEEIAKIV